LSLRQAISEEDIAKSAKPAKKEAELDESHW